MISESKAIVFIEPLSKTMDELYEILEQETKNSTEFELYRTATPEEVCQTLPQLGPALIVTADYKICAQTLSQNKAIIKGLKSKVIIINSKKLPPKILDKFHKSGLTDYILEPIAVKTLLYKVRLLVKSLPTIGSDKEFLNQLKQGEEKKENADGDNSTLVKKQNTNSKTEDDEKLGSHDTNSKKIAEADDLYSEKNSKEKSISADDYISKEKASRISDHYSNETQYQDEQSNLTSQKSNFKEKEIDDLKGSIQDQEKLSDFMKGSNLDSEINLDPLKGKTLGNIHESSYMEGENLDSTKMSDSLKGKNYTQDLKSTQPMTAKVESEKDLGGHYVGETHNDQKKPHKPTLKDGKELEEVEPVEKSSLKHSNKSSNKNELEIKEEIEIEYIYEEEIEKSPFEGQVDHLQKSLQGKNIEHHRKPSDFEHKASQMSSSSGTLDHEAKSSKPENKNPFIDKKNSPANNADYLSKNSEAKELSISVEKKEAQQLQAKLSKDQNTPNISKKNKGYEEKTSATNSHESQVAHIEKYYGLKTAKTEKNLDPTWKPFQAGDKKSNKENPEENKPKISKDKKMLQFGQLTEGRGQINYEQIFENFNDLKQDPIQTRIELENKKYELLTSILSFHQDYINAEIDCIALFKKFHFYFNKIFTFEYALFIHTEEKLKEIYHSMRGRKIDPELLAEFQLEKDKVETNTTPKMLEFFESKHTISFTQENLPLAFLQLFIYKQENTPSEEWFAALQLLKNLVLEFKELKRAA